MGFINLEWLSGSGLTLGAATEETGTSRQPTLRCADVHPVPCDAEWTAPSTNELVARAVDHGVRAHGLNPGWYTRQRIAAIRRAARGAQPSAPPDSRSETAQTTPAQQTRDLQLDEAAAVLRVSPDTLRAWEQRFGYPHSGSGAAGERRYPQTEVIALRDSLEAGLSIAAAINKARSVVPDT
ncbi:MAG: DUF1059 domain-containing protein [Solirubrobacteraceae bacterium]